MGKVKRGNREIIVTSKTGEVKKYLVPLSKQILVQENDYVRAGTPLSDGATTPADILAIKGPTAVQEYIVNEVQDVYRLPVSYTHLIKSKNEVIADIVALLQSPAKNVISALQSGGNTLHGVLKTLGER